MFNDAENFNKPLNNWDTSKDIDMIELVGEI